MAADVPIRLESPVLVTDDEHRLVSGAGGEVAPGPGEGRDMTGELPGPFEDQLLFGFEQSGIDVEAGLQGGARRDPLGLTRRRRG